MIVDSGWFGSNVPYKQAKLRKRSPLSKASLMVCNNPPVFPSRIFNECSLSPALNTSLRKAKLSFTTIEVRPLTQPLWSFCWFQSVFPSLLWRSKAVTLPSNTHIDSYLDQILQQQYHEAFPSLPTSNRFPTTANMQLNKKQVPDHDEIFYRYFSPCGYKS